MPLSAWLNAYDKNNVIYEKFNALFKELLPDIASEYVDLLFLYAAKYANEAAAKDRRLEEKHVDVGSKNTFSKRGKKLFRN